MSGKLKTVLAVAIGAAAPISLNAAGQPPEWIMLMPAGNAGIITTVDGRGPYRVTDASQLITASLQAAGGMLPIDENHATDLAGPNGQPSPARGWVTDLQARADGIYGKVEWSEPGKALMAEKAYRFISPVFTHDKTGKVGRLLRASLVNNPNLHGMAALNAQETNMDLLAQLRTLLGLADDADEAAVIAKITALTGTETATAASLKPLGPLLSLQASVALNSQSVASHVTTALASIAKAAGLNDTADVAAITTAVSTLAGQASTDGKAVVALQSELAGVTTKLNTLTETSARDKATTYVDGEIAKGRVGLAPVRDRYITMHMTDPAQAEALIGAMVIMGDHGRLMPTPPKKDAVVDINDSVALAAAGRKYMDEQKALGLNITIADAIVHVTKDHV